MELKKKAKTAKKKPDMSQERDTIGRSKNRKKRRVAQIDPNTYQVVKVWDSMGQAESTLKIRNVTRAILKRRCAGGFFWCDEKDIKTFIPKDDARGKRDTVSPDSPSVAEQPAVEDLPPLAEKLNPGHSQPQPGKTTPKIFIPDEEIIKQLQSHGWEGELTLTMDKLTIKIQL